MTFISTFNTALPWRWQWDNSTKVRPCVGLPCIATGQVRRRYQKSAWEKWSGLFGKHLQNAHSRRDYRSLYSLSFLMSVGFAALVLENQYLCDAPPQAEFIRRKHVSLKNTEYRTRYPSYHGFIEAGCFYSHHGLRDASPAIRKYLWNKEIFDVGAFYGDSLTVLEEYTNIRVRSFELIPGSAAKAQRQANKMNKSKHVVMNIGLADKSGCAKVVSSGRIGSGMHSRGSVQVNISTIDDEVESQNLTVGFIKLDVEGFEPQILRGAMRTLQTQHPILSISSYHNIELFDLPSFLEEVGGYRIEFQNQGDNPNNLYEQAIMAYPHWVRNEYPPFPFEI